MGAFLAIVRRQLRESGWALGISAAALFGLSWLFVFLTSLTEAELRKAAEDDRMVRRFRMMRAMGGTGMDFSSAAIEMTFWMHPMILLPIAIWAISRGSAAPAGEIEKGTLDLTLSRPVSRVTYLGAQMAVATVGLIALVLALIAGNVVATPFNAIQAAPSPLLLVRPALNLAVLGLAIYAFTLVLSTVDLARWRPNLVASILALASYVSLVVAALPVMEDSRWKPWLERVSIFKAYQPVDAIGKAANFGFNVLLLLSLSVAGMIISALCFQWRDIPANS